MALVTLIDTYSLFFRAYYALPMMHTSLGEPTSALYGFCSLLLKIFREQKPSELMFALDGPSRTFRRERYEGYKATRARIPADLGEQLDRLNEVLQTLALPTFAQPGFEADDVLATLACKLRENDIPGLVVSGDRDLLQTAHGSVRVLFIGARGKDAVIHDATSVEKRFGVHGQRLASYTALVGDTSDNLPGVPGVGPRTAATLLNQFHDISAILSHVDEINPPRLRESLVAAAEQLRLNEELARLHETVPLPENPPSGLLSREVFQRLRGVFEELEFKSLSARLEKIENTWPAA